MYVYVIELMFDLGVYTLPGLATRYTLALSPGPFVCEKGVVSTVCTGVNWTTKTWL